MWPRPAGEAEARRVGFGGTAAFYGVPGNFFLQEGVGNFMKAMVGLIALLLLPAAPASYRIDLKGGGTYWSASKPGERSGRYVFRTADGTVMSVRVSDVARVRRAATPGKPGDTLDVGPTSPAAAAQNQKVVAEQLRAARRRKPKGLLKQYPYRPGVGEAYPASPNDYRVGKTFAFPPSGKVYEGPAPTNVPEGSAPTNVPEGSAPMLEPPPPPPHR